MLKLTKLSLLTISLFSLFACSYANTLTIPMHLLSNDQAIGIITAQDTPYGLLLTPQLKNLPPGIHGFHVHLHPSCANKGMAAGGHLDPQHTNKHLGPYNNKGHLGDLPVLIVNQDGSATLSVLAPRLTTKLISDHSLMIHVGGDNYSDIPKKLGGGGARLACGIIGA